MSLLVEGTGVLNCSIELVNGLERNQRLSPSIGHLACRPTRVRVSDAVFMQEASRGSGAGEDH